MVKYDIEQCDIRQFKARQVLCCHNVSSVCEAEGLLRSGQRSYRLLGVGESGVK